MLLIKKKIIQSEMNRKNKTLYITLLFFKFNNNLAPLSQFLLIILKVLKICQTKRCSPTNDVSENAS